MTVTQTVKRTALVMTLVYKGTAMTLSQTIIILTSALTQVVMRGDQAVGHLLGAPGTTHFSSNVSCTNNIFSMHI